MKGLEEYLEAHYSPRSVRGYKRIIGRYCRMLGQRASQAQYSDVVSYLGQLREEGLHARSLRNHLYGIKIYYHYLIGTGQREDHPCKGLQLKDRINRQIQIEGLYSREELEELYTQHQSTDQRRDEVIISLLIYQGLTVQEISALKVEDVDLEGGRVHIRGGENRGGREGNRSRTLGLKPKQILMMYRYETEARPDYEKRSKEGSEYYVLNRYGGPLWSGGINRLINRCREGKKRLQPQKIRQSVIALMLKENKDIRLVQAFSGHRRTGSTEAYAQTGLEELKASIEKYHPLQ